MRNIIMFVGFIFCFASCKSNESDYSKLGSHLEVLEVAKDNTYELVGIQGDKFMGVPLVWKKGEKSSWDKDVEFKSINNFVRSFIGSFPNEKMEFSLDNKGEVEYWGKKANAFSFVVSNEQKQIKTLNTYYFLPKDTFKKANVFYSFNNTYLEIKSDSLFYFIKWGNDGSSIKYLFKNNKL